MTTEQLTNRNKKMFMYSLYCLLLIILLTSCISLKPTIENDDLKQLTEDNLNQLEGDYEIFSTDTSFRTLDFLTTFSDYYNFIRRPKKGDFVNLKAIDNIRLQVTIYNNDTIIESRIIKGSLKQNYFDYKIYDGSFYFLINVYKEQNNRIAIKKNGNLSIDAINTGVGFLVFIPLAGGGSEHYNLIFKRRIGRR